MEYLTKSNEIRDKFIKNLTTVVDEHIKKMLTKHVLPCCNIGDVRGLNKEILEKHGFRLEFHSPQPSIRQYILSRNNIQIGLITCEDTFQYDNYTIITNIKVKY